MPRFLKVVAEGAKTQDQGSQQEIAEDEIDEKKQDDGPINRNKGKDKGKGKHADRHPNRQLGQADQTQAHHLTGHELIRGRRGKQ